MPKSPSKLDELGQPSILSISKYIIDTGLFDGEFYLASNPDIAAAGVDPFDHFFRYGFQEGRCPNPYFEPSWYLDTNTDAINAQIQPLLHYVLVGEKE